MLKFIVPIAVLAACSREPAKPSTSAAADQLREVFPAKLAAFNQQTAADHGFPSVTDCDGTVWAGTACLGGVPVDIDEVFYPDAGELQRRPKASGTCYPAGSSSTASRDDAVLFMACAVATKNIQALKDFEANVNANSGYLGVPHDASLTLMTETLKAILARATGSNSGVVVEAPGLKDYQENIEAEEILLSTAVNGGKASGWEVGLLDSLVLASPKDAFFQAAKGVYSGDCKTAAELLLAPTLYIPSYVRGDSPQAFQDAWWLRAAALVLKHCS